MTASDGIKSFSKFQKLAVVVGQVIGKSSMLDQSLSQQGRCRGKVVRSLLSRDFRSFKMLIAEGLNSPYIPASFNCTRSSSHFEDDSARWGLTLGWRDLELRHLGHGA